MSKLGALIYRIISLMEHHSSEDVQTLRKVFNEHYQYITDEKHVITRPKEEVPNSAVLKHKDL
jgi:hypothetical protein